MKHMDTFPTQIRKKNQSKQIRADLLGGDNVDKLKAYLNGRIKEINENLKRPEITPYFETYLNVLLKMYTEFLEKFEEEYAVIEQPF